MNLFHRHTFNANKWKEISRLEERKSDLVDLRYVYMTSTEGSELKFPEEPVVSTKIIYTNTCLTCGDLITRVAATHIPDFYERHRLL